MPASPTPGINFEDIGKRIEGVNSGAERLESILMSEYYDIVKQEKLYDKEHVFSDSLKDKLIDTVSKTLKEQLIHEDRGYEGISDYQFEKSIMQDFFGVSKTSLKLRFKNKSRITKEDIGELINDINGHNAQKLISLAVADIGQEHIDMGKEYLKKVSDKYKLSYHPEYIIKDEHLKEALIRAHQQIYRKNLNDKYV